MSPLTRILLRKEACFVLALTLRETSGPQAMAAIPRKRNQGSQTKTEPALISLGASCSCSTATCPTHRIPSRCRPPQTKTGRAGICHWRRSGQRAGRCTSRPAEEEGAEFWGGPAPAPTVRCAGLPCSGEMLDSYQASALPGSVIRSYHQPWDNDF